MEVGTFGVKGGPIARREDGRAARGHAAAPAEARAEGYGPIGGILLLAASVLSIPGALLMQPPTETYLLTGLVALTGLVCLAIPWERISPGWLHALGVVATLEVGASVAFVDPIYGFYFVVIAVLAAHGSQTRIGAMLHLGLIAAVLFAPILWEPESSQAIAREALLLFPSVALAAAVVLFLRERLEAQQRRYSRFAEEAFELTWRIRGIPTPELAPAPAPRAPLGSARRSRPPSTWFPRLRVPALAASLLLALPLATSSLAIAGVGLPGIVVEPLTSLGFTPPDQAETNDAVGKRAGARGGSVDARSGSASAPGASRGDAAAGRGEEREAIHASVGAEAGGHTGPVTPQPSEASVPASPTEAPVSPDVIGGAAGPTTGDDVEPTVDRSLHDATAKFDLILLDLGLAP
jgi:hypothetical protein